MSGPDAGAVLAELEVALERYADADTVSMGGEAARRGAETRKRDAAAGVISSLRYHMASLRVLAAQQAQAEAGGLMRYHLKTRNIYIEKVRCNSPVAAQEGQIFNNWLMVDDVLAGDPLVIYYNALTHAKYARLASNFDDLERYIPLSALAPADAPEPQPGPGGA